MTFLIFIIGGLVGGALYNSMALIANSYGFRKYITQISEPWSRAIARCDWELSNFYLSEALRFTLWWKPYSPKMWIHLNEKFGEEKLND